MGVSLKCDKSAPECEIVHFNMEKCEKCERPSTIVIDSKNYQTLFINRVFCI